RRDCAIGGDPTYDSLRMSTKIFVRMYTYRRGTPDIKRAASVRDRALRCRMRRGFNHALGGVADPTDSAHCASAAESAGILVLVRCYIDRRRRLRRSGT